MVTMYDPSYLSADLLSEGTVVSRNTEKRTLTSWTRLAGVGRLRTSMAYLEQIFIGPSARSVHKTY